ncbi:MAG: transporter substrate-binding domain-containing protein [Deltaproteobacteria bacterium]|jgi:L-cystine transport system substrate-binding protein|nr:transporter substrate-binding domain-containing protein [Deltaproteobacteria bacterium]
MKTLTTILTTILTAVVLALFSQASLAADGDELIPPVIKVGTMGTFEPFTYVDENNVLTGFDIEVLKEIQRRDPVLNFEFIASPWDTLFPGLDADKFQMIANQIAATEERKKKYVLTDNSYFVAVNGVIVRSDREDIKDIYDLQGKKIGMTIGDNRALTLENWNKEHDNILEITYFENDLPGILVDIINGRLDATVNDPLVAAEKARRQGLTIKSVGERITQTPVRYIFKSDPVGVALRDRIDRNLKQLIDEGYLTKYSIELFGVDYSK